MRVYEGDNFDFIICSFQLDYVRPFTLMELQRYKRQFITYTKMHPVDDVSKISKLFVQYLQSSIK